MKPGHKSPFSNIGQQVNWRERFLAMWAVTMTVAFSAAIATLLTGKDLTLLSGLSASTSTCDHWYTKGRDEYEDPWKMTKVQPRNPYKSSMPEYS